MPRYITAFLVSPLLFLACSDPASPTVTRLSTDAVEYTITKTPLGYGGNVTLSFTNANGFAVGIPRDCSGNWRASLERRQPTDGVWVYATYLADLTKCAADDLVVPAGATGQRVVALRFFPAPPLAGEYRVVMDVRVSGLPDPFTSNTFTLLPGGP